MAIRILIDTVTAIFYKVFYALNLLATPFLSVGLSVLHVALWPLRFLARFETLFIFLTVAVLTGIISGLVLYGTCTFLVDFLPTYLLGSLRIPSSLGSQLDGGNHLPEEGTSKNQRLSSASYGNLTLRTSDFPVKLGDRRDMRPLSSTILEEEESSQESGGDSIEYGL